MAETILVPSGEAYPIEWSLWDGAAYLTGKTVTVSIERYSDGKYWNGADWQDAYIAVNMTERTGSADLAGKYRYVFTPGDNVYDVHTTYTEGTFTTYFRQRIVGQAFTGGSIIAGPVSQVTEASQLIEAPVKLEMFALESRTFVVSVIDADGDPVSLSGKTLRFVVIDSNNPPNHKFQIENASITVSGDDNEIANIPVTGAEATAATTEWHWRLWDLTNSRVLANGPFVIYPAKKDDV